MSALLWLCLLVGTVAAEGGLQLSGAYAAPPPDEPDYQDQLTFESPPPLSDQYGVPAPTTIGAAPAAAYGAPPPSTAYGAPPPSVAYGAPPPSAAYGAPAAPAAYAAQAPAATYGAPPPVPAYKAPPPPPPGHAAAAGAGFGKHLAYMNYGGGGGAPFGGDWVVTGGLLAVAVVLLSLVGLVSVPLLPTGHLSLPDIGLKLFDKPTLGAGGRQLSQWNLTDLLDVAERVETAIQRGKEFIASWQPATSDV